MTRTQRFRDRQAVLLCRIVNRLIAARAAAKLGRHAMSERHRQAAFTAAEKLCELIAEHERGAHWTTTRRRPLREVFGFENATVQNGHRRTPIRDTQRV
ncbi:MAG TPA: hypothetical protein VN688_02125 [Gemmataceae bacterium]|nr:hypothetical protein [Gemmataceae bacterium]